MSSSLKKALWAVALSVVVAIAYAIAREIGLDLGPPPVFPEEL